MRELPLFRPTCDGFGGDTQDLGDLTCRYVRLLAEGSVQLCSSHWGFSLVDADWSVFVLSTEVRGYLSALFVLFERSEIGQKRWMSVVIRALSGWGHS